MEIKKITKRIVAVVCSLAMIVSSMTISNTAVKADAVDVVVNAILNGAGQIEASWTHPEGVEFDQERYYLNVAGEEALDEAHYAKAANGWVWSIANPTEIRTALDSVTACNDNSVMLDDGGDFVIVVQYLDAAGEVVAQGTSNVITVEKNVNKDLGLFVERYEIGNMAAFLKWTKVAGAVNYIAYDEAGNVVGQSGGDWTQVTIAEKDKDYVYTVKAFDGNGVEIDGVTNNVATARIDTWQVIGGGPQGYLYHTDTTATIVNVQQPPWAGEVGVYMHVPAGISEVSVNGATENVATLDGAGVVVFLSALTKNTNEIVIKHGLGTATVKIKNENVAADGEEESSGNEEESTEEPTSAPSGGDNSEYAGLTYTQVGSTDYYVASANDDFPFQLLEDQGVQMLIIPQVAAGNKPIWPDFSDATLNGEAFDQIAGAGIYIPYDKLEDNAYNVFEATSQVTFARFQIIIKAGNPSSGSEGPVVDAGVNVLGWQVSCGSLTANGTTYDGGIRTVYAIDDTVAGKSTAGATVGLVYGLAGSATEADMVVDSTSDYVTSTVATANGVIDGSYGQNDGSTLYAVIMAANLSKATAASVQREYMVRAYVEIDGTYYYSDVATYSVYSVAKVLYDSASMQTATGHAYVYNILTKVDAAYPEVVFGAAGNTVVKPE